MSNEEIYDLKRASDRLAEVAVRINDEDVRGQVLKCVYKLGETIDKVEGMERR
ncbi:MAG: hypothetical protein ACOCQQ_01765 [Candidatus Nanoarchaeia archaeon]